MSFITAFLFSKEVLLINDSLVIFVVFSILFFALLKYGKEPLAV